MFVYLLLLGFEKVNETNHKNHLILLGIPVVSKTVKNQRLNQFYSV